MILDVMEVTMSAMGKPRASGDDPTLIAARTGLSR